MSVAGLMIESVGQVGVIAALGLLGALLFPKQFRPRWFFAAIVLYLVYNFLLTRAFGAVPDVFADSDWNWVGKLMSLAGMLAVAAHPAFGWRHVGLTMHQQPGWRSGLVPVSCRSPISLCHFGFEGERADAAQI